jgi:tetratricopeptide (TPR) repeat protein
VGNTRHSTVGTYQHYLPASYLGRFSADTKKVARSRPLWVRSLTAPRSHIAAASKVGGAVGLYDVDGDSLGPEKTLDTAWGYESYVPRALDALERRDHPPDARDWLLGAVVFVAGLFARGPEFQEEFAERLPAGLRQESPRLSSPDHATGARLIDLQVLLAPVLAARWAVVHFRDDEDLVVSDRGYTLRMTPVRGSLRYAIPVSRQAALVLTPRDRGTPLRWSGSSWVVEIEHFDADPGDAAALNQATGAFARQAVFGSSQQGVEHAGDDLGKADRLTAGLFEVLDPASHLYDYFRVLIAIAEPPGADRSLNDEVDWKKVSAEDWQAPIVVELLFLDRTQGGVRVSEGRITIDLTYGIEQRRARKLTGDFRMGALSHLELDALKSAKPRSERAAPSASPTVDELHREAEAVAAFDRGKAAYDAGRMEEAEAGFRESDKLGNPAGSVNLGNVLRERGHRRAAEAAFRRAVRRGNSNGSLNLAAMYLERGDLRKAEKEILRAQQAGNPRAPEFVQMLTRARGPSG